MAASMWSSALPLCLLLSTLSGGEPAQPDPQYMMLVPTLLHEGHEAKLCFLLSHLNESISLSLTLELNNQNVTILEKQVTETDEDNCVTFQTPNINSPEVGFFLLRGDGDTLHFTKRRSVLLKSHQTLAFVQTDKPIYKPGQEVLFRIASMDENFYPVSEHFPEMYIENPQGNRIAQWLDVETHKGIVQKSFQLTAEPIQGTYKVIANRQKGNRVEHPFSVEEYVLSKYEVQVKLPPIITIEDQELHVTVCSKYTYGKPVSGLLKLRVCRKFQESYTYCPGEEDAVCEELEHPASQDGCHHDVIKTKLFQMKRSGYQMTITAKAKIIEDGTGVEMMGEASTEIKSTIAKVSFREVDTHFRKGIPAFGQVFLEDAAGNPLSNKTVAIFVGYEGTNFTYTTGPDGTADFSIDTTSWQDYNIRLRVTYKTTDICGRYGWLNPTYEEQTQYITRYYSMSNSFLKIKPVHKTLQCGEVQKVHVHYALTAAGTGTTKLAVFRYLIMAKGDIVISGKHTMLLVHNQDALGHFSFKVPVSVKVAPLAKVVIFVIMHSGEVIADFVRLKVDNCFQNKVKLSFAPPEGHPGSQTTLKLHTDPESFCAVRAVDSSVLLMKPEAELSAKSIYDLLPLRDLSGYNHDQHFMEEPRDDDCVQAEPIFLNGLYYNPSSPISDKDAYTVLMNMGLKILTNTKVRSPVLCERNIYSHVGIPSVAMAVPLHAGRAFLYDDLVVSAANEVIVTERKYFPETWLWNLYTTDSSGEADVPLTVPDTITTWKASMYCTSSTSGFGLSETESFLAFQPFFVDITAPYSAIREETFTLRTTVFSYMFQTMQVRISMEETDQYIAKAADGNKETYCIERNGKVTLSWNITLKALDEVNITVSAETLQEEGVCGNEIAHPLPRRKDTITKHILVKPEGVEKEETHNAMLCGKGSDISETFSLRLPEQVVEGSVRGYFSVIGDVMGTAMQNMGSLLKMPFGCGEQNMVLFAPNIYVLEYLNNTNQLTPELKAKALNFLNNGYQRQLSYRHYDGSYSAFGPPYGSANTWLTAFTMKSFARARPHIYIEEKQISDPRFWLSKQQKDNGCFRNVGSLFNNAMKGGVEDEITLSAYIVSGFMEMGIPTSDIVVRNALFCLENAAWRQNNVYTDALLAYTFALAKRSDLCNRLLQRLDEQAIRTDDSIHWHRQDFSDDAGRIWAPHRLAPSAEVEMTSYALMARLVKPDFCKEDMTVATKIVNWMVKQRNPNGGFSSTQDTVVALQSLAVFGSLTQSHEGPRQVSLSFDGSTVATFQVEDSNRLLLQSAPLDKVPGDYTVTLSGTGCVFLQASLKYNVPHPKGDAPFCISVTTEPETCSHKSEKTFTIAVNASYTGKRDKTNMAIVDIKLPSGYIPVKATVRQLINNNHIKRAESFSDKVIVYFDELTKVSQTFRFVVEQDIPVGNLQPSITMIYDYYETDEFALTKYSAPCSSKDTAGNE